MPNIDDKTLQLARRLVDISQSDQTFTSFINELAKTRDPILVRKLAERLAPNDPTAFMALTGAMEKDPTFLGAMAQLPEGRDPTLPVALALKMVGNNFQKEPKGPLPAEVDFKLPSKIQLQ